MSPSNRVIALGVAAMLLLAGLGISAGWGVRDTYHINRLFDAAGHAAEAARWTYAPRNPMVAFGATCGDGAAVRGVGFPSEGDMDYLARAAAALVPDWAARKCEDAGHPYAGMTVEYVRLAAYDPGVVDIAKARSAADEAARMYDPTARVVGLQMTANPFRLLVRVRDGYHEAQVTLEPPSPPYWREPLARWSYLSYLHIAETSRWLPGDIRYVREPIPSFDEYRARLDAAGGEFSREYLRAMMHLVKNLFLGRKWQ